MPAHAGGDSPRGGRVQGGAPATGLDERVGVHRGVCRLPRAARGGGGMSLPIDDWQFWVVTVVALFAAWFVLRAVIPESWWGKIGLKRKPKGRAASLTVEGKAV